MPNSEPLTGRVAFGTLELLPGRRGVAHIDPAFALGQCLVTGTLVERYDRQWRMGPTQVEDGYISGRIGFQAPGGTEELWNEEEQDFQEQQPLLGSTSPFVINVARMEVVFQLRSGRIRPTTFTSNFQSLLNQAGGRTWRWRVEPKIVQIVWEEWVARIDRISEFSIRIQRPNPNYQDREHVKELVEGTRSELVRLVMRADEAGEGLDIDDALISEAIDHAAAGYGSYHAKGERQEDGAEVETEYRSAVGGEPVQGEVAVDPETKEAPPDALKELLAEEQENE